MANKPSGVQTFRSVILIRFLVYDALGVNIGYGYSVFDREEGLGTPILTNYNNENLPEDWYGLRVQAHIPAIMPENIQ